jgi:hypothetical protein
MLHIHSLSFFFFLFLLFSFSIPFHVSHSSDSNDSSAPDSSDEGSHPPVTVIDPNNPADDPCLHPCADLRVHNDRIERNCCCPLPLFSPSLLWFQRQKIRRKYLEEKQNFMLQHAIPLNSCQFILKAIADYNNRRKVWS